MATTNPVFQVLIPTGNQSPLAAGSRVTALAVGQIGVFNYHTGLSVDGSVAGDCKDVFLAVGLDVESTGSLADIAQSAGQVIQARNARSYTVKGYVDHLPKIIDITGFKAKCETDYILKIEFRNNKIYMLQGYNQFSKTFNFTTGCCSDDCTSCEEGDCNELADGLVENINADTDALVTATMFGVKMVGTINTEPTADGNITVTIGTEVFTVAILNADTATQVAAKIAAAINATTGSAYQASNTAGQLIVYPKNTTHAVATVIVYGAGATGSTMNAISTTDTAVTHAGLAAFETTFPDVCLGIKLTGNTEAINTYCSVNPLYYSPRGTDMIVSLTEGFTCNGSVDTAQELQYPEGKGYDVGQMEYEAGGWNGKPGPYRVSETTNLPRSGYQRLSSNSTNYNMISLTYDQQSVGGWLEYLNNLETRIAIPCADSTTLTGLVAILDLIFSQFGPNTNDVASMDCTNGATSALTASTDGIESLSY